MIPYSQNVLLVKAVSYGAVNTETVFGFGRLNQSEILDNKYSATEQWELNNGERRSFNDLEYNESLRSSKRRTKKLNNVAEDTIGTDTQQLGRKAKSKGVKKCIFNIMKARNSKKKKRRKHFSQIARQFMMPLILGVLAAKSLLIPIAFKVLALLATKGLLMGLFATIIASVFGLRSMFHSHNYQRRKDDLKPQVQVPYSSYEHYYDDNYYRREDNFPEVPYVLLAPPHETEMNRRKKH